MIEIVLKKNVIAIFAIIYFLCIGIQNLQAQSMNSDTLTEKTIHPWQEYLDELGEMEDVESSTWEDYEDILEDYAEHPLNINIATREDLSRLPFLTAQQVEDIQAYIYRYGGMKSLGELQMLPSLSWYHQQLLGYFVYAGDTKKPGFPSVKSIMKYGKHEVVGMVKIPFYERRGDVEGYAGYPYKHWLRYQFHYSDFVKVGFVGSQDAGEPFAGAKNKTGYDFYSFYFQIRKMGRLKNLTLGRYRMHWGLGLVLNNDFSMGKLVTLSKLGYSSNAIRVYSSRYAANYLQGAAATVSVARGLDLSAFISYRQIDATIKNGGIQTILASGLHRTESEIERQNNASAFLTGGNINFKSGGFHAGATAIYYSYSLPLTPDKKQLYKQHAPEGNRFWNAGVDYGYISHRWNLAGEIATGSCGAFATLNTASYLFSERFSLIGLYRFYSYRYYSLYANSFSEGSDVQDENGLYVGVNWMPFARLNVTAYTDFAYFAWPKYRTSGSTSSVDWLVNAVWTATSRWTLAARYRYKHKLGLTQRARLYLDYNDGKVWSFRSQIDGTHSDASVISKGWMFSQRMGCSLPWLKLNASAGYFNTDDYPSRVYIYEPGLLYTMSFGSFYGKGMRYALSAKVNLKEHLLLMAKLGLTHYFDRNHISSGLQEIQGSTQADLEVQLKWKF